MVVWNYVVGAIGIGGQTISSASNKYENLFTPASYAFSIWGIIFIGLILFSLYLLYIAYQKNHRHQNLIIKSAPYLITANILNSLWSYLFISDLLAWSLFTMFGILIILIITVVKLNMSRYDADFPTIAFIWWPISLYIGWISVAAIANNSAYLSKIGFDSIAFGDYTWTIIMIIVATIINLLMIKYRNMREFGIVGIWSLISIAVRHQKTDVSNLAIIAYGCAGIILLAIIIHGYQNRRTGPVAKFKQWQNS